MPRLRLSRYDDYFAAAAAFFLLLFSYAFHRTPAISLLFDAPLSFCARDVTPLCHYDILLVYYLFFRLRDATPLIHVCCLILMPFFVRHHRFAARCLLLFHACRRY